VIKVGAHHILAIAYQIFVVAWCSSSSKGCSSVRAPQSFMRTLMRPQQCMRSVPCLLTFDLRVDCRQVS
jgi:hypothetical protein